MRPTTFAGKSVPVTGANRGLGQALVDEALRRGCTNASTSERDSRSHMQTGAS